jgi:nucleoside-diphosphate-sugar epimerase
MGNMKKVVITGHTKGLGKEIYEYFIQKGYSVFGYSKSTGYDISLEKDRHKIINFLSDANIFVNNAYDRENQDFDSQLELLKNVSNLWQNLNKTIINISSFASDYYLSKFKTDTWRLNYRKNKFLQDQYIKSLYSNNKVNIINLKPIFRSIYIEKEKTTEKLEVLEIRKLLDIILNEKNNFNINSLTFSPKNLYE